MYIVDMYFRVRRACLVEGMSIREASRVFGLHRDTVRKMLSHPVPPGYRRKRPPYRPKLEPYTGVIDRILEDDLSAPKKQRHTHLRATARRAQVRWRLHHSQGLRSGAPATHAGDAPLSHPPGHAQCDFGQAWAIGAGSHLYVEIAPQIGQSVGVGERGAS